MKKTMFITSVIMVVVMAIALTTSSLAWFTANGASTVSTAAVTLTAKSNASTGLLISTDNSSWKSGRQTLTNTSGANLVPMVPLLGKASGYATADVTAALSQSSLIGNTTNVNGTGETVWAGTVDTTSFYEDAGIYVANAGDADIHIAADIAFTNVHGATLFVAVLAEKAVSNGYSAPTTAADAKGAATWEIIRLESSTVGASDAGTVVSSLACGKTAELFGATLLQSAALADVAPTIETYSTVAVKGKAANAMYGGSQRFKVVAWYSTDLYNGNSGAWVTSTHENGTSAEFTVTFSIGA